MSYCYHPLSLCPIHKHLCSFLGPHSHLSKGCFLFPTKPPVLHITHPCQPSGALLHGYSITNTHSLSYFLLHGSLALPRILLPLPLALRGSSSSHSGAELWGCFQAIHPLPSSAATTTATTFLLWLMTFSCKILSLSLSRHSATSCHFFIYPRLWIPVSSLSLHPEASYHPR